jgi:hypothetical protein
LRRNSFIWRAMKNTQLFLCSNVLKRRGIQTLGWPESDWQQSGCRRV